jgi:hypothetical protein
MLEECTNYCMFVLEILRAQLILDMNCRFEDLGEWVILG